MKKIMGIFIILVSQWAFGQISGTITDEESGKPVPYVNVWVKNNLIGATTRENGTFLIEKAKIGDTIHISSLGYSTTEFLAKKENMIALMSKINELDEVVVIPMMNSSEVSLVSYKKVKKIDLGTITVITHLLDSTDIDQNMKEHPL